MEFDKSRVYTALNADELKQGDKVIVGSSLLELKTNVECNRRCGNIVEIGGECSNRRFTVDDVDGRGQTYWELAYLMERAENCTNCEHLGKTCNSLEDDKITYCGDYKPNLSVDNRFEIIARARKHIIEATNIEHSPDEMKVLDTFLFRCWQMGWLDRVEVEHSEPKTEQKAEPHYRPFKDTDELIKVWCEKGGKWQKRELTMPLIWVRNNFTKGASLITHFWKAKDVGYKEGEESDYVTIDGEEVPVDDMLTYYSHDRDKDDGCPVGFTFLDGSPCGVEE